MGSSHIRDLITSFSPNLGLFAITVGDGRIKIWDTVKGQVQTEFVDIISSESGSIFGKQEGHLSMVYTCMKWLYLDKKKKRKLGTSLLILGTSEGDVLGMDVSTCQVNWRINNCHPGGVGDVSFPSHGLHIYTAGADGVVCKIDSMSGNLLDQFTPTSRAISSLSVSADGKLIAVAAAQLKVFNCSNYEKVQKFSGHPGAVRCMIFSEDGNFVLSSSLGERYVAIWKIDGSKKKSACSFLAMDHPAVFLESRCINNGDGEDAGLAVLAISEIGIGYFWYAKTTDALRNSKPTKICISSEGQMNPGVAANILAAKLQSISEPACGHVFLGFGFGYKPSFIKVIVHSGTDIDLNASHDGILLPINQFHKSIKAPDKQNQVTALDGSISEGTLLPVPKVFDMHDGKIVAEHVTTKDESYRDCLDTIPLCMEDQLISLGILHNKDDPIGLTLNYKILKGINLESITPDKKAKAAILSMEPKDASNLLKALLDAWQFRFRCGKHVLPWIRCILVYHGDYVKAEEPKLLDTLYKFTRSKGEALSVLLQLSGRLQLVSAQIDKAANNTSLVSEHNEQDDESEDELVEDGLHGVDTDSLASSADDDE